MAGAGYKLFATGDVLTAAEVNTYLQQQVTMVFANSTARTTALSGVLAEGMMSYLQDTNTVEVYNGSNWVNVGNTGDVTEVQAGTGISVADGTGPVPIITNTVATEFDAKGDLVVGTGADTFDKLVAGGDGETLVADSAATTGLRWNINQSAGKNSIINGDFRINQRAFSSSATDGAYTFDRWMITALSWATGTVTYSAQTFTPGAAPVSGYEGINFLRCVTASLTGSTGYATITQRIEDVRTFAGQTVTMSLWAKAGSGTPNLSLEMVQNFGSGGSTRAPIAASVKKFTLSTSWTRYSFTFTVPSVSGKTIGTGSMLEFFVWYAAGSDYNSRTDSIGIQNGTFDIWGVQIEAGSVATAFQTATGTLQGELAACQRYFIGLSSTENVYTNFAVGVYGTTTIAQVMVPLPVTMRVKPSISVGTVGNYTVDGVAANVCSNLVAGQLGNQMIGLSATTGASTLGYACYLRASNTTSALIQISAEL